MAKRFDRREMILGLGAAGLAASALRATPAGSQDARAASEAAPDGSAPTGEPSAAGTSADAEAAGDAGESTGSAAPVEETAGPSTGFLVVQTAEKVFLSGGRLELRSVAPSTIYVAAVDRLNQGQVPTVSFVNQWSAVRDRLPSASMIGTLSLLDAEEGVILELRSPMFKSGNLVYEVAVLEGPAELRGGAGSLFIDVVASSLAPSSIEGHRSRRRRGP